MIVLQQGRVKSWKTISHEDINRYKYPYSLLEDTHGVLNNAYSDLIRMASEHQCQIILHPGSLEDLSRDKDDTRKQNILAKAKKYPMLESPPTPKEENQ